MTHSSVEFSKTKAIDTVKAPVRVLHVDDEADFLKTAEAILELQGEFQVETASSVDEAWEKMKKEEYDVVICDYQMPGKDGLLFLEELREKGNGVPFIIFTGKGSEEVAIKALNLGADGYFDKMGHAETVYDELTHGIHQVVEKRRVEQSLLKSEDKYRRLIETLREGIWVIDKDSYTTFVNPRMAEILGYNVEEMKGRHLFSFMDEHGVEICKRLLERRQQGIKEQHNFEFLRKDGSRVYATMETSPITDDNGNYIGALASVMDITEHKKAEQMLEESEEKYRGLVELAPDGIVAVNVEGIVISANSSFLRLIGYDSKEVVGKPFTELKTMRMEDIPKFQEMFRSLMNGEPSSPVEFLYTRRDGTSQWAEVHPGLLTKEGNPVGIQVIMRDVSERRKTQEKLKNSEERLKILFEFAPDAYYLNDLKGTFIDGNKAAEEVTGYSKSELIGRSFLKLKLLSRSQIPKATKLLVMNAMGKPTGPDEFILNRKDRTQVPVEIRTFPVKIEGQTLVLGIARDVSIRKEAERLVLESQKKFEQLFMSSPEAAAYVDPNQRILNINPRFTELFGYSFNEVKEKILYDFVAPEDRRKETLMLAQKGREGYTSYETVRKNKKGSLITVTLSSAPIMIQGQHLGNIMLYMDITERKKAEEERRETMEKLELMNEKLRVVGGLTRHDIRNKLTAVTGNAYLARKKLPENSEVLNYMKQIETSVEQTVRILEFAKVYEMLGVEELVYVDMEKTVNKAISLFSGLKDIKVMNDCHGLTLLADSLLTQLFYNLIDNSLKYAEKLSRIRVYYEEKNSDHLAVIYEDDGVGIPRAAKPKLFDEGYTTGKGSGYGLFLVKKMMEVYGWTIQETGESGKGAQFTITIPRTNKEGKEIYRLS